MPADDGLTGAALAASTVALLRHQLPSALHPFAAHVTRQLAHPPRVAATTGGEADMDEASVATGLALLLQRVLGGDPAGGAATTLARSPVVLSACFQNLDLLPPGDAAGDAVALLVVDAIERLRGG